MSRSLVMFGGVAGALGVSFAAMAAHLPAGATLLTAAHFLLFHAPVFLFLAVAARLSFLPAKGQMLAVALLGLGLVLFCGDLSLRAFFGQGLFKNAAPIGGSALILGWLALAMSGAFSRIHA